MASHEDADGESNGTGRRRQDTITRQFSDQISGAFNLEGELPALTQSVEKKRQTITLQSRELEELQARIAAAEEKLRRAGVDEATLNMPQSGSGSKEVSGTSATTTWPSRDAAQTTSTDADTRAIDRQEPAPSHVSGRGSLSAAAVAAATAAGAGRTAGPARGNIRGGHDDDDDEDDDEEDKDDEEEEDEDEEDEDDDDEDSDEDDDR